MYWESHRISSGISGKGHLSMARITAYQRERSLVSKGRGASKDRLTSNSPRLLVCGSPGTLSAQFLPKSELSFRSLQYTYCLDASPRLPHQTPAPALEPTCPFPLAEPSV